MKVGDSIYIPNIYGDHRIWERRITEINIADGETDIVINGECHYKINDVGKDIFLNKNDAYIELDTINEQKYKDFPVLRPRT